jgi:FO synthase subunit 2
MPETSTLTSLFNVEEEALRILEKALAGERITEDEALYLFHAPRDAVFLTGMVAHKLREQRAGSYVTYVVNRNINFTNICVGSCTFCAFRRRSSEPEAYLLTPEQVAARAKEAVARGASEVCIQGGLHPEARLEDYVAILKAIKSVADVHVHAFSPMEVYYAAQKSGIGIKETLRTLKEAGLDSMPGTAAEILVDEVRAKICPAKLKTKEWVEVITQAHRLGIPTTATMLYGHVESASDKVEHLRIIREIQDSTQGFTEFVPLSFIHYRTSLYASGSSKPGATGMEDLKVYAISRLYLDNFRNIQVSWVKLGRKLAQLMLGFGANDFGGTLMEENISRSAGASNEMMSEAEIRRLIRDAGFEPRKRDTLYNLL